MTPAWVIVSGDFLRHRGQDRANYELARHLAERGGAEVHVVASGEVEPSLLSLPGVRVHRPRVRLPSYYLAAVALDGLGKRTARAVLARHPGARVIVNGGNCAWPDVNWVHAVHDAWDVADTGAPLPIRAKNRIVKWDDRRREKIALGAARLVFANSRRTRDHLVVGVGVPSDRVHLVYLGIDPDIARPASATERAEARTWLGVTDDRVVAVFVGALGYDRNKGFDTLLRAWQLLGADPSWNGVVIAAGGGKLAHWQRAIDARGLHDRVRLLGQTPRVKELLAAADVFVSPTRYDAYGLAVQEAVCREIPAIVSERAGITERFPRELDDLVLRDPDNAGALAQCLRRWRERRAEFRPVIAKAAAELRQQTWERMAAQMIERIEGPHPARPRGLDGTAQGSAQP